MMPHRIVATVMRGLALLGASLALAACHTPGNPVVPDGQAGYDALTPAADAQSADYRLYSGDIISVRVYEEPEMSAEDVVIDNGGSVNLPLIGDIQASGRTTAELATAVEAALGSQYLRYPRVSVQVRKARVETIAVEGQVQNPGVYPYEPGQTLLTALALARSPTDTAKLDEVMIFRVAGAQPTAGRFDVKAIRDGRMPDVALVPGDKVVVGFNAARSTLNDLARLFPVFGIFRPF